LGAYSQPNDSLPTTRDHGSAAGWVAGLRGAVALFLPWPRAGPADLNSRSWWWFVPIGLLIGCCWAGLFRASWRVFGEVGGVRLMPALVVLLADAAFFSRLLHVAAARTCLASARRSAFSEESPLRPAHAVLLSLVLPAVLLAKFVLLASLPAGPDFHSNDWRRYLLWAYPRVIYRPLALAPAWACWGVLLAAGIGRSHPAADEGVRRLSQRWRPLPVAATFLVPAVLTTIYGARQGNVMLGTVISLAVLAVTFLSSVALTRRQGGQTRDSLLAAGLVGQLSFLFVYLGFSKWLVRW